MSELMPEAAILAVLIPLAPTLCAMLLLAFVVGLREWRLSRARRWLGSLRGETLDDHAARIVGMAYIHGRYRSPLFRIDWLHCGWNIELCDPTGRSQRVFAPNAAVMVGVLVNHMGTFTRGR